MANYLESLLKQSQPVTGEDFGGSIKLTQSMSIKLRPASEPMKKCAESLILGTKAGPCRKTEIMATLADQKQITRHQLDQGRQVLCRMMRACPVANHAAPEQRRTLSCGQTQIVFDRKLGKI